MKYFSQTIGGFFDESGYPPGSIELSDEYHAELISGQSAGRRIVIDETGYPILADPPPPTQEQIIKSYTDRIQSILDAEAQTRNYDGIMSACTYAASTIEKFRLEGLACVAYRDGVWATYYSILDAAQAGTIPAPTIEDIINQLPAMVWP